MPGRIPHGMILDRASSVPPYRQIRDLLMEGIRCGRLRYGERLPTAAQLRKQFSVSHHTLNRAIQDLKREGWVTARVGSGVFVSTGPDDRGDEADDERADELGTPDLRPFFKDNTTRFLNELQSRVAGVHLVQGAHRKDIVTVYAPMLPCLAHNLTDLSDVFLGLWGRESTADPVVAPFCHDGRLLMVGSDLDVLAALVNESVFEEAGVPLPASDWTLDDMFDIARRIHCPERGRYGVAHLPRYHEYLYFLWHEGGEHFDAQGTRCELDSPPAIRAMQRMAEWARMCCRSEGPGDAMAPWPEERAGISLCAPDVFARTHAQIKAPHRLLCLPEYRRGIVPVDASGVGLHRDTASRDAGIEFMRLYMAERHWRPGRERLALCLDRSREDTSPATQAFRDSLPFTQHVLSNVPPPARSLRLDLALHLFSVQCQDIAMGDAAKVPERMADISRDMTRILNSERLVTAV